MHHRFRIMPRHHSSINYSESSNQRHILRTNLSLPSYLPYKSLTTKALLTFLIALLPIYLLGITNWTYVITLYIYIYISITNYQGIACTTLAYIYQQWQHNGKRRIQNYSWLTTTMYNVRVFFNYFKYWLLAIHLTPPPLPPFHVFSPEFHQFHLIKTPPPFS